MRVLVVDGRRDRNGALEPAGLEHRRVTVRLGKPPQGVDGAIGVVARSRIVRSEAGDVPGRMAPENQDARNKGAALGPPHRRHLEPTRLLRGGGTVCNSATMDDETRVRRMRCNGMVTCFARGRVWGSAGRAAFSLL